MNIDIILDNINDAICKYNKNELNENFDNYLITHCEVLNFKK